MTGMPSDILWSIEERRAAWGIVSMDNQLARERRLQSAIIFGISTFVVMLALVAIEGFPTAASVLVGGLAVLAIGGVVSSRVGNPISDTPCAGKEVYMDSNRHGTRRFRLLTVLALSVVTLGTMAAYAFSLEAWGDTLTVLFSIVGSAVMAVGLVALLLLIADLVRARGT
ncbi:MAG TPA: hypothetical protein VK988_01030 [Acidimicrobiales bacterium]|nr:hypothetical protein [Acidimicrobiales bacterium]